MFMCVCTHGILTCSWMKCQFCWSKCHKSCSCKRCSLLYFFGERPELCLFLWLWSHKQLLKFVRKLSKFMSGSLIWQKLQWSYGSTLFMKGSGQFPLVQWIHETFVVVKEWWLSFVHIQFSFWLMMFILLCNFCVIRIHYLDTTGIVLAYPFLDNLYFKIGELVLWDKYSVA